MTDHKMTKDEFEDLYGATKLDVNELLNIEDFKDNLHNILNCMLQNPDESIWSKKIATNLKSNIRKKLIQQQKPKSQDELPIPRCFYCKRPLFADMGYTSPIGGDIEHILNKSNTEYRFFTFSPFNLALACRRCNHIKNRKDLLQTAYTSPSSTNIEEIYDHITNIDILNYIGENSKWIHPYYDNYHECMEIFYDYTDHNEGHKAILYRPHENLPEDKKNQVTDMISALKLNSIEGQEEAAFYMKIAFLGEIKDKLKDEINLLDLDNLTQDVEEQLIRKKKELITSLELNFLILYRNM